MIHEARYQGSDDHPGTLMSQYKSTNTPGTPNFDLKAYKAKSREIMEGEVRLNENFPKFNYNQQQLIINYLDSFAQDPDQPHDNTDEIQKTNTLLTQLGYHNTNTNSNNIVNTALSYINHNIQYKLGSKDSIDSGGPCDCSGFTKQIYQKNNIEIPDGSISQMGLGAMIDKDQLQSGDLIFFSGTVSGRSLSEPSHVGIYDGNGNSVSLTRNGVRSQPAFMGYWGEKYLGARRIPNNNGNQ